MMVWDDIFRQLAQVESFFWSYVAFVVIALLGSVLTLQTSFFQIRALPATVKTFWDFFKSSKEKSIGVHPIKVFFASVGGMIGIGNVVAVVTAVQLGGPGALVWVWVAALLGSIVKYSEIYLGLKHRVKNDRGSYDGGPMYFLPKAFSSPLIPMIMALLLCIYGVEIYQFAVVTQSISSNFDLNRYMVIVTLLILVIYSSLGGVARVGKICSWVMPFFIVLYVLMSGWVIFQEVHQLPAVLHNVLISAFSGHAAVGAFAGSGVLMAVQHGVARAAYSADIGIGYDSIIQSESYTSKPEKQARLAILGVAIDNFVCTLSILVVLLSGVWALPESLDGSLLVQTALSYHFPYMHIFIPIFLLVAGYTTMIAYFCVGIKCARFLHPRYGLQVYVAYGIAALLFFSFFDQTRAMVVMSLVQALLLTANLLGIFRLRHQIEFIKEEAPQELPQEGLATEVIALNSAP
jgi:AGCS family alanine or glycine:cation symporter